MQRIRAFGWATVVLAISASSVSATTWNVPGDYASVQAAIDVSVDGDVIDVAAGLYVENLDFAGKSVAVIGRGRETIIHGTGEGSVVRFASGEGAGAILDSVVVRGGNADVGGGILI